MTAPKRRWFRFSLRTFLVGVTLFGGVFGWTAYNLNWIRQRHEFFGDEQSIWRLPNMESEAPGMLWLFGEEDSSVISVGVRDPVALTAEESAMAARIQKLFPEAGISFAKQIY